MSDAFSSLGLSDALVSSITAVGYSEPTPIQTQAIPPVLEGRDVLGLAQTGTGKTAAFGLPLIERLLREDVRVGNRGIRALILAPTRELVIQIADNLKLYGSDTGLSILSVVGGASLNMQTKFLARGADILVATPGRLMDLHEREALTFDEVSYLVLDEADQMLDLGFLVVLKRLSKMLPSPRQTLLFSATMPKPIAALSKKFQDDPVRVEVAPAGTAAERVHQVVHYLERENRVSFLKECLSQHLDGSTLVFARTKRGAERLKTVLVEAGFAAVSVHGDKRQSQRMKAIAAFKEGEANILVATDVAARGIDISGVSHVYNYDLPDVPEVYVHRIGRTARAGAKGEAITFCRPVDLPLLMGIEILIGQELEVASGERPSLREIPISQGRGRKGGGGRQSGRGRGGASSQGTWDSLDANQAQNDPNAGGEWQRDAKPDGAKRKPRRKPSGARKSAGRAFGASKSGEGQQGATARAGEKDKRGQQQRKASRRKAAAKRMLR